MPLNFMNLFLYPLLPFFSRSFLMKMTPFADLELFYESQYLSRDVYQCASCNLI
jgi:hypothetical protein